MLEVNALKFAYNRSVADCAAVSLRAVLAGVYAAAQRVAGASADAAPARKPLLAQLKKAIARWSALLRRYVTSDDDQADLIASLEVRARAPRTPPPPPRRACVVCASRFRPLLRRAPSRARTSHHDSANAHARTHAHEHIYRPPSPLTMPCL